MSKHAKSFLFSFVIPVYNAADYIEETIDSLLKQTFGFEEYCEIVLVDDGSTDGSADICKKYVALYPNNIVYVKQKNAGPGEARNKGANLARGKYINPIDSDDKLSHDTLQEVYDFFEKHNDIDVVTIKWELFEAQTGGHPLNYKFTKNRVIDLRKDFTQIQCSVAPAFFRADVFKKYTFNPETGRYGEDARFMGEVFLDNPRYGVVSKPTYYYRKRFTQTSSQDKNKQDKFWYLETPKRVWADLFEYSKKTVGSVPKYIQFMAMYDLQWRFKQPTQSALNDEELAVYKILLYSLLEDIDDDVILAQKNIFSEQKLFILGKKHNVDVTKDAELNDSDYFFNGTKIYNKTWKRSVVLDIVKYSDSHIKISGHVKGILFADETFQCFTGKGPIEPRKIERYHNQIRFLGEVMSDRYNFELEIPASHGENITFKIASKTHTPGIDIEHGKFSKLPEYVYGKSYGRLGDDYLLCQPTPKKLVCVQKNSASLFKKESQFLLALLGQGVSDTYLDLANRKKREYDSIITNTKVQEFGIVKLKSACYRIAYWLTPLFVSRRIWLISDRPAAADDNGEIFFEYLSKQADNTRNDYFVIDNASSDKARIDKIGKTVHSFGLKHKLLFLRSDKVISSEATDFVTNPLHEKMQYLKDLYSFDFVFLQHGVIRDDISGWLNKFNKNISLFVTSARPEQKSIMNDHYNYSEREVILTGLPRYDKLKNRPKNKVILMPTWRLNLAGIVDKKTGDREYNPGFTSSRYYDFWQSIIDDTRIRDAFRKHSVTGELYLHPSFKSQINDFHGNEVFEVKKFPYDYPKAKSEGSLLITDYSSVALDFAYLQKPILYAQFDDDTYYEDSTSDRGYLSYEKDGLGPVVYNYEDTIAEILKSVNAGFKVSKKYTDRTAKFFYKFDKNNCKRIYDAINDKGLKG